MTALTIRFSIRPWPRPSGTWPGRNLFPGQGPELAEQAGLVALDRDQVVGAAVVQVGGVLALGVQRVRGDQHVPSRPVDLVEQAGEHGDLVRLAVHGDLGADHAGAVIQARQQVRRGILRRSGRRAGSCRPPPAPAAGPAPGGPPAGPLTHAPDRAVQRSRVHRGQHPPDGHQVRDRAAQAQPGPQPRRGVSRPIPRSPRTTARRPGSRRPPPPGPAPGHTAPRAGPADPGPAPALPAVPGRHRAGRIATAGKGASWPAASTVGEDDMAGTAPGNDHEVWTTS